MLTWRDTPYRSVLRPGSVTVEVRPIGRGWMMWVSPSIFGRMLPADTRENAKRMAVERVIGLVRSETG